MNKGELFKKAIDIAKVMHKGQLYGDKDYFTWHLTCVALLAEALNSSQDWCLDSFDVSIVSYLHDVIEDTDMTGKELYSLGFKKHHVESIELLSRDKNTSRNAYIKTIKTNRLATLVKIADTMSNLSNSIQTLQVARINTYTWQLKKLLTNNG